MRDDYGKFDVATTMTDGKIIKREIVFDGMVVGQITEHDLVEFIMKQVSSLRFSLPTHRM